MEQHIQQYTKYINEALQKVDIDTATYKEHLHKVFEWYGCIILSRQSDTTVLCWEDVPADLREEKCMSRDMGIDAFDIVGKCMIQMKLYHGTISWRALSTFLACHHDFMDHKMILYRNTESHVCDKIADYIKKKIVEDRTVTDAEFRKECKRIQKLKIKTTPSIEKKEIRPYQQDAKQMIEQAHERKCNLIICLPTGTGKTWVVLDYHLEHRDETTLILVPTRVLLGQWNDACKELCIHTYLVDSNHHRDLKKYNGESIVICVYDSYKNIHEEKDLFQRIVADEAHHIFKPERYMETEDDYDDFSEEEEEMEEEERPISSMSLIRDLSQTNRMIYLSATLDKPDDETLYYEYKVRQAISDGYLCDYQFIFPIFEQKDTTNQHLSEYLIHRQNETHCLIYASNCKEGKEFVDMLNAIHDGCAGYIDADTTAAKRTKLFADFESGKIRFLINIRVLVEGFNAPHIRSIFFLRVSSSEIFIIQAIGRALRLHPDKIKATIYVPFTHEEDIDRIQAFLTQLSTYDERIKQSLMQKKVGGYLSLEHGEVQEDDEKTDDSVFEFRYNLIVDRMGNSNQLEEMAIKRALEYKAFYEEFGRKASHVLGGKTKEQKDNATDEQNHEQKLAQWFSNIQVAKKGKYRNCKLYPSVEIILIELLGESWYKSRDLEELSIKRTLEFKTFHEENQRKPVLILSGKTKEQKENATDEQKYEQKLAVWFCGMKRSKKKPSKRIGTVYPSVEQILIELLGKSWYDKTDFEDVAFKHALEYKTFYEEKQRYPTAILKETTQKQKDNATKEQKYEHTLALWFQGMKTAKRGVKNTRMLYPSVEKFLIKLLGKNWCSSLEDESLKIALEYKAFYQEKQRKPSKVLNSKTKEQKDQATEEQKYEHRLAQWLGNMKSSKKGQSRMNLYPSVEEILIELLGETWYENENLEDESLKKVLEYKAFYEKEQRKPSHVLIGKIKRQNATKEQKHEQILASWYNGMKDSKKGKGCWKLYPSVEKILIETFGEEWYN
jgi:superfamily II DNA or RNA helicase